MLLSFRTLSRVSSPVFSRVSSRSLSLFNKRYAFTRDIDDSLKTSALTMNEANLKTIDLKKAREQHHNLTNILKGLGLKIFNLPSSGYPDSVFIEDMCVIIENTAMITHPGAKSRQGEISLVREYLRTIEPGRLIVTDLKEGNVDGGDVMFTGKEILVGLTTRTNEQGIRALQNSFPTHPVRMVNLAKLVDASKSSGNHNHGTEYSSTEGEAEAEDVLHLKSFCPMCGDNTILVGGKLGATLAHYLATPNNEVITSIQPDVAPATYEFIAVPDTAAANVVYVNGVIVRRARSEYPLSDAILRAQVPKQIRQIEVEAGELAKVDGALSCCSVLY